MASEPVGLDSPRDDPPSRSWQRYILLEMLLCAAPATVVLVLLFLAALWAFGGALIAWRVDLLLYALSWAGGVVGLITLWSTLTRQRWQSPPVDSLSPRQVVGPTLGVASAGGAVWTFLFVLQKFELTIVYVVMISLALIPALRTLSGYVLARR